MYTNIDDLLPSPSSSNPWESIAATTINDPVLFNHIHDFLRDFSQTEFDPTPLFTTHDAFNTNTSDTSGISFVDHYQQSSTVNPICTVPTVNGSQISGQEPLEQQQQPTIQLNSSKSRKIEILSHPRSKFRPRTEKESQDSSHYIRCEDDIKPEYPTIRIWHEWNKQKNIIEVTLVDKDKQPHPYTIDNKESKTSPLIFKHNEQNTLYFHVTEQDCQKGQKTFLIEYIKPKQDDTITKDLIKTRQLAQSMLRFTRFYQIADGSYQRDESSTEYSCLMTEDYGDFSIEDVFPLYGPMCGNQKVCVELKGYLPKDLKSDLNIYITENQNNWFHQIENIKKNRNNFTFLMPTFPYTFMNRAKVDIIITYKQDTIYQSSYIYTRKLDEELNEGDLDKLLTTVSFSNTCNELNGALLSCSSMTLGGEIRGAKRSRQ